MPNLSETLGLAVARRAALALTIEGTTSVARQLLRDAQSRMTELGVMDTEIARLTGDLGAMVKNAQEKIGGNGVTPAVVPPTTEAGT